MAHLIAVIDIFFLFNISLIFVAFALIVRVLNLTTLLPHRRVRRRKSRSVLTEPSRCRGRVSTGTPKGAIMIAVGVTVWTDMVLHVI